MFWHTHTGKKHASEHPEINVYSCLEMGHKGYAGRQFVHCNLMLNFFHTDLRIDKVLFIPFLSFYTGRMQDFEEYLHICWYGTVVLLFRATVKSYSCKLWECNCHMTDVLFDLQTPRGTCKVFSLQSESLVALQCSSGVLGPWCGQQQAQCVQLVHTVQQQAVCTA